MLGPLEVRTDEGAEVEVVGARLRGLLTALALEPGRIVATATLAEWIWGPQPPAAVANALQRLISRLRKELPDGVIESLAGGYRLAVDPEAVDAAQFERLVEQARRSEGLRRLRLLREALALWRGAAMEDVGLQDSAALDAAATRLQRLRLTTIEDRCDVEVRLGDGARLIPELTDLAAAHPLRERLVGALMRALSADGRDSEALLVYQRTKEALADALGVDPSPELSALHVALLQGEQTQQTQTRNTNLRAELTSFVGKEADVAAVGELVAGHRLTTLIGPGGAGKTRLACETARTLLRDLPEGAWFIELAALGADGDVAQATLAALGLRDALTGGSSNIDSADRLVGAIREREVLLILDNCEHMIESAAVFAQRMLGQCRRMRILATSREPLGITGETLWQVEPLALPQTSAGPDEIESSPAVQLLRDRAGAARKDIAVDAQVSSTMAHVCRALDGMPLAIELAAARLRTMSLDQLAHRLDDRFRLLTNGSRTVLPRHQTLRAVVDWSWELLTHAEQQVLRRLAVFSGAASLEAAERVCAGDGVEQKQLFEVLTALTEKSLLVAGNDRVPRYRMIGMIQEYSLQRLREAGEADLARHAHLAYFTELAETADPHLLRAEQLEWLAALDAEHDNIVAAMRGALAAGEAHAAMRLAAAAGWYWWLGGHRTEGMELIAAAAETPGAVPDEVRAMVYAHVVTFVTSGWGGERQAEEWILKAYRFTPGGQRRYPGLKFVAPLEHMLRAPDEFASAFAPLLDDEDPWVRALGRLHLGKMRTMRGQGGPENEADLETALAEFQAIGERFGIWFALTELADQVAMRGEYAEACRHCEQAVGVVTELGSAEDLVRIRAQLAQLYSMLGDAESSAASISEAERYAKQVAWPDALAELAISKAELARWRGDRDEAYRQLDLATASLGDGAKQASIRLVTHGVRGYLAVDFAESREHRRAACQAATEVGHAPHIAQALVGVADLALRCDQHEQAARLLAASAGVRGRQDRSRPDFGRIAAAARRRLGDARFDEAMRAGARADWSTLAAETLA